MNPTSMQAPPKLGHWLDKHPSLMRFGHKLFHPNVWHFNQYSVVGAVFWGLLCSFIILPVQSIPAIFGAIYFRINLPLAYAFTWFSNPFTALPILYIAYLIGAYVFHLPAINAAHIAEICQYLYVSSTTDLKPTRPEALITFQLYALFAGLAIEALVVSISGALLAKLLWGNRYIIRLIKKYTRILS